MAAAPPTTKDKPAAAQAAPATPKPEPKPQSRGFGAFMARQMRKFHGSRPDHSWEGFILALKAGIQFISRKDWNTSDHMIEELEHQIRTSLRVPTGVYAEFVARDRDSKQPRILVLTDWGFREAVEGQISFALHSNPDVQTMKTKG